jgi:double-strand break repair protein MRE11
MNEIKILISTDNHLGYLERDPVRGDDSFKAFQEVFEIAKEFDVDMILLGGDLFHDNKPSRSTLYKTMNIIRQNCFGNRKCDLKILSDQAMNFPSSGGVNFQDPNINISLPIFSIHGNHDDPTGEGNLCSLDLLSSAGLVNYFGKVNNVDDISIFPLLLSKGNTKLAVIFVILIVDLWNGICPR